MQTNLSVANEIVYVATGNRLMAISVADPEHPAVAGELDLEEGGILKDVATVPNGVLLIWDNNSTDEEELLLVDSSNLEYMQILGRVSVPDNLKDLAFESPYAYISGEQIWVANITEPENLRLVGTSMTPGALHQVDVQNGIIYGADGAGGLLVLQGIE